MASWVYLVSLIISSLTPCIICGITCLDEDNKPVDWFVVYKLPKLDEHHDPIIEQGLGYYYMDPNNLAWQKGKTSMDKSGHAIANTINQINQHHKSKDVLYIIYNDETPEKNVSYSHGHTKGDIAFDKTSGYWLVHSLPRFPNRSIHAYEYPSSGHTYGQTFLCVSYSYKYLNSIGEQLLYNYPQIYDSNYPASFLTENEHIAQIQKGEHVKKAPWKNIVNLTSLAGQLFTSFAKFTKFDADLYHDLIAPHYDSNVLVESWLNGVGNMNSNCTGAYKAFDIQHSSISGNEFSVHKDHSKWTVTMRDQITCIGDINRQLSQKTRAGGTVCFHIPEVWSAFNQSVQNYQPCPHIHKPQVSMLNHL